MQDFLDKTAKAKVILDVINAIVATVWFFSNQTLWSEMSHECHEGFNKLDFWVWIVMLVFTLFPTIVTTFLTILLVCCSPCICMGLCAMR